MDNMKSSLLHTLQGKSEKLEKNMDSLKRKRTGSYYTNVTLTAAMMQELVLKLANGSKPIEDYRFLEPCVGTGNFVFSYLNELDKLGIDNSVILKALDNIYVVDINESALEQYKAGLKDFVSLYWGIELDDTYFNSHIGTGLLVDVTADKLDYIAITDVFGKEIVKKGFDIIVTNPPYKNLKAESSQYTCEEEYEKDKSKYASISRKIKPRFKYSIDGNLNLYKLFVEEIIENYAANDAYISLLIPSAILSDKTGMKLRTHILQDMNLISVKVISEGSGYVNARQALSALLIHKGENTETVSVTKDYCRNPEASVNIKIDDIINKNTGNAIFAISEDEYAILRELRKFPVVKDLNFIVNCRGELDLTANKKFITANKSDFKLLRGRNIGYYELLDVDKCEYVDEAFVSSTSKHCYIENYRIICQQVANMHKERRVTFAYAPKHFVLGNSCNFISVAENIYGIDLYTILGLFNTKLINWFFKLTSSNNHVNNYEIDCFPVPVNSTYLKEISFLVKKYLETEDASILEEIECIARKAYNIEVNRKEYPTKDIVASYMTDIRNLISEFDYDDARKILNSGTNIDCYIKGIDKFETNVVKGITDKYRKFYNGFILNHTTFKLSDLDLEMISSVPQGGCWKDIPMETVKKSQRLEKITKTGGRTTLYGRIDYNKPSYTITTYFNRPGNGTYIHPIHDRVISVREAARFQTFRDDYYFWGNKTQILKQVGNAVPTILAYQIARQIKAKTGCWKSVDLFCGAGGMTAGFKFAGIKSLISNDIEESVCTTLKINNPEISVLCGDITKEETKLEIEKAAKKGGAEIICGGPPCQGFSMAGFRSENDPRNQLFRDFVDMVRRVNPKIIVFENVDGLLSYNGGETYKEIHTLFSELGFKTEGRVLMANDYAVPQRRKRIFIICTRNDLDTSPSELFPEPITTLVEEQVTAKETIYDLEAVECSEKAKYTSEYCSDILDFLKRKISYEDYIIGRSKNKIFSCEKFTIDTNGQLSLNVV